MAIGKRAKVSLEIIAISIIAMTPLIIAMTSMSSKEYVNELVDKTEERMEKSIKDIKDTQKYMRDKIDKIYDILSQRGF